MSLQEEFPPCGEREVEDRQKFMIELLCVVLILNINLGNLSIYYKNSIESVNSISFNLAYILVAPVVFLDQ